MAHNMYHATRYPPCDSYFVESHQPTSRVDLQEREKIHKKECQLAMAQELSRRTAQEYEDDILQHMEQMDVSEWMFLMRGLADLSF